MAAYFARRLLLIPVTFFLITLMVYAILRVVPGGPIEQAEARLKLAAMGEGGGAAGGVGEEGLQLDEDAMRTLEAYYSLDKPIPVGYLQWLGLMPRERLKRIPAISRRLRETEFADLTERMRAVEDARDSLRSHLSPAGLVAVDGALYRPMSVEELPAHVREAAEELRTSTFGRRYALQKLLEGHGLAFADGRYLTHAESEPPGTGAEFREESRLLIDALARAEAALDSAETRTGYYLLEPGRLEYLEFRPLHALKAVEQEIEARIGQVLSGWSPQLEAYYDGATPSLTVVGQLLHRSLRAPEKTDDRFFTRADELAAAGVGKRDDLLRHLESRGYTWTAGVTYRAFDQSDELYRTVRDASPAGLTKLEETLATLTAARHLARQKLDEVRESSNLEVAAPGHVYEVERVVSGILQLDFGQSYTYSEPVLSLIGSKMEVSIQFGLIGYLLTWIVCVPLGVFKALKHRSSFDTATSILVFIGYAVPGYVLCMVLLASVAVHVEWLPLGGYKPENIEELDWLRALLGRIRHMIIPVTGYMIGGFATMTILTKNSLLNNLSQDYVRTAFAKGLSEKRVIFLHALRNSLIPITAGIGQALGLLFAGSFLIEKTCNIDGMGLLGFQAILERDYPITMGLLVFLVLVRLFGNIISDIIWAAIDPRIRFGS
jgi:microcin C transport system permease protein